MAHVLVGVAHFVDGYAVVIAIEGKADVLPRRFASEADASASANEVHRHLFGSLA